MGKDKQRGLFPGALELMILRTLVRQPLHGYALVKAIQQASDELLQIEEGSLYPALQRLLVNGWVSAEWGVTDTGRKARTYRITAAGRKHLVAETSEFEQMLQAISRVMARGTS